MRLRQLIVIDRQKDFCLLTSVIEYLSLCRQMLYTVCDIMRPGTAADNIAGMLAV